MGINEQFDELNSKFDGINLQQPPGGKKLKEGLKNAYETHGREVYELISELEGKKPIIDRLTQTDEWQEIKEKENPEKSHTKQPEKISEKPKQTPQEKVTRKSPPARQKPKEQQKPKKAAKTKADDLDAKVRAKAEAREEAEAKAQAEAKEHSAKLDKKESSYTTTASKSVEKDVQGIPIDEHYYKNKKDQYDKDKAGFAEKYGVNFVKGNFNSQKTNAQKAIKGFKETSFNQDEFEKDFIELVNNHGGKENLDSYGAGELGQFETRYRQQLEKNGLTPTDQLGKSPVKEQTKTGKEQLQEATQEMEARAKNQAESKKHAAELDKKESKYSEETIVPGKTMNEKWQEFHDGQDALIKYGLTQESGLRIQQGTRYSPDQADRAVELIRNSIEDKDKPELTKETFNKDFKRVQDALGERDQGYAVPRIAERAAKAGILSDEKNREQKPSPPSKVAEKRPKAEEKVKGSLKTSSKEDVHSSKPMSAEKGQEHSQNQR